MAQLMPLPLTVSCSSKIQIGFTFLVPAYPGCPGKEAVKWLVLITCDIITIQTVRLVFVGLTHEMSYTADSIRDSIRIRIVTPDSIRIRFERKWPIRRSLLTGYLYTTPTQISLVFFHSYHIKNYKNADFRKCLKSLQR